MRLLLYDWIQGISYIVISQSPPSGQKLYGMGFLMLYTNGTTLRIRFDTILLLNHCLLDLQSAWYKTEVEPIRMDPMWVSKKPMLHFIWT